MNPENHSRRQFLTAAGATATLASFPYILRAQGAGNNDTLKIGLIGCGGRGTSAETLYLHSPAQPRVGRCGMADSQLDGSPVGLRRPLLEQAIHTVDKIAWAMNDVAPIAASGGGGRSHRSDDGNVWDHYEVTYEYPNGTMCHIGQRQMADTFLT